ncbi:hypothetical protein PsorP6_017943 [Peronosclerospora sorghi]|uniref:Uncharacterized protein n=1 Tax=Peronosclerospora sorghi TaxID=230839 RepID=A0ACC0WDN8_9STRA|nr:hypothetical protein PsorP6_017943 [Peronosclerospora sorghi]
MFGIHLQFLKSVRCTRPTAIRLVRLRVQRVWHKLFRITIMLWRTSLIVAAVTWYCLLGSVLAEELCSILPSTYTEAKKTYPHLTPALETVEKSFIAARYTDRLSAAERSELLSRITEHSSKDTRMVITVYGIPNKDCNAGLSSSRSVHSTSDYQSFLSELTKAVGDR